MKKVLLIQQWGGFGGSGLSLYYTWKSLEGKYDVVTYIPDNPSSLLAFLRSSGLNAKTFPFRCGQIPYYSGGSNLLKLGFWYITLLSIFQIPYWKKVIAEEQPDLIMVNSKVLCWMGKLCKKTKSLCFVRETIPGSPNKFMNRIMKYMLEDFTLVVFLSKYDLVQTGLKKAETLVSPDFLEMTDYSDKIGREAACKQLKIDPMSFNVLFVGGIDRLKGIDIAVKSIDILKNEDITLIVAGNDFGELGNKKIKSLVTNLIKRNSAKFSKGIKAYINKKGLENKIRFIGIQTDMSIPFSACDVLIFPMKEPHQARPAFEIGVQKKPVIIADFSNICEFVKDGVNGLTFEPNNPESLAQAILRLKNDRNLLAELGKRNYEYTMKYHTENYAMGELIDKITELLK